ncbi:MAG: hypothetical protein ABSD49_09755 [Candidatus Bathyarchaeia archaeon]|jgi:NAD(P)H-dependent flavin oxidoreductase YrpB (nitropropane dioxygenase family)
MAIDWMAVAAFVAGAGIVGTIASILTTWMQFQHESKESARSRFREMMLSEDFVQVLGCVYSIVNLVNLRDGLANNRSAKARTAVVMIDQKIDAEIRKLGKAGVRPGSLAVMLLLPKKIREELQTIMNLVQEKDAASVAKEMETLTKDLKEILGFSILK